MQELINPNNPGLPKNKTVQERFWYWMAERQNIFTNSKELNLPAPWTKDPILQKYSFCNVFREEDIVTKWIKANIREPYKNSKYIWFMMIIARFICHPETLQKFINAGIFKEIDSGDYDAFCTEVIMQNIADSGEQVHTGAYLIPSGYSEKGKSKWAGLAQVIFQLPWNARETFPQNPTTLESVWQWYRQFHGSGPFMSYEYVTDLRHTPLLENAVDIHSWANPGPGARRGLNRYHERQLTKRISMEQVVEEMKQLMLKSAKCLPAFFPKLEMRDIEHSLCEYDKYERMLAKIKAELPIKGLRRYHANDKS